MTGTPNNLKRRASPVSDFDRTSKRVKVKLNPEEEMTDSLDSLFAEDKHLKPIVKFPNTSSPPTNAAAQYPEIESRFEIVPKTMMDSLLKLPNSSRHPANAAAQYQVVIETYLTIPPILNESRPSMSSDQTAMPVANDLAFGQLAVVPQFVDRPEYGPLSEDKLPAYLEGQVDFATYKQYLQRLCRHNMDVQKCGARDCYVNKRVFTCPAFLNHECDESFQHQGYIHRSKCCKRYDGRAECDKEDCRQAATLVHVKGMCHKRKEKLPCNAGLMCNMGHDNMDLRRNLLSIMKESARQRGFHNFEAVPREPR